jgi:hypothetical protein
MKIRTIVLILLMIIPISSANEYTYCFKDCHNTYSFGDTSVDECGNCHNLYFGNPNFATQHEPKTCPVCHAVTDLNSYHTLHVVRYNVSCSTCHIDNTVPDNTYSDCISCHIGGLHVVHIRKECSMCHADIVPKKIIVTNETIKNTTNVVNESKALYHNTSIVNYKRLTIYEILKSLYEQIKGDIYGIQ